MIKAVVFDIGQTLVQYHKPLNWKELYRPALLQTASKCNYVLREEDYSRAIQILTKYNTRIYPREYEVSSDTVIGEILNGWNKNPEDLKKAKSAFYSFFRNDACLFEDVKCALEALKGRGISTAALSDVAYGMDNEYALEDISEIMEWLDLPLTSNDTGYRKPNIRGLQMIGEKLQIEFCDMAYVGDEEKDMACANHAGAVSILINRGSQDLHYNHKFTITSLNELPELIGEEN